MFKQNHFFTLTPRKRFRNILEKTTTKFGNMTNIKINLTTCYTIAC
jgi:hypothetical protein